MAQNLVINRVVVLKVFILVRSVLMLGVIDVDVLPCNIRNTLLQLDLVPGFELRGTQLDEKGRSDPLF